MADFTLSKTNFINYLACPEALWTALHSEEEGEALSIDALHTIKQGMLFDDLTQDWFKAYFEQHINKSGLEYEFQTRVEVGDYLVISDILVIDDKKRCDIYEVKGSTGVKSDHVWDVAFQKMVFELAGYTVENTYLVHVDKAYERHGEVNLAALVKVEDITEIVLELEDEVIAQAQEAVAFLTQDSIPKNPKHLCGAKGSCLYRQTYCAPNPAYSVFDIARINAKKLEKLINSNTLDIQNIPSSFPLSAKQRKQVDIAQSGETHVNHEAINTALDSLEYPLYFLDYETYAYIVPCQDKVRPYQQMIFQYSLHIKATPESEYEHHEYLLRSQDEPITNLLEALQSQIPPTGGTVIVWNQSFEKSRNKETAIMYPAFADWLLSINERVYDLMTVFSKGHYQHPDFKGSYSIKKVLPVLCPKLSYQSLHIQDGGAAVVHWHEATTDNVSTHSKEDIFRDLLKYCELDTWAMVKIWEELRRELG